MKKFEELDDNGKVKVRTQKRSCPIVPIAVCCLPVVAFIFAWYYLSLDATPSEIKEADQNISHWQKAIKMMKSVGIGKTEGGNKGTEKSFEEYKDEAPAPRIEYIEPSE